jgi:hypothetical protein
VTRTHSGGIRHGDRADKKLNIDIIYRKEKKVK